MQDLSVYNLNNVMNNNTEFHKCKIVSMYNTEVRWSNINQYMLKYINNIICYISDEWVDSLVCLQCSSAYSKANTLGTKVSSIAWLAEYFSLSLTEHTAVHPLPAEETCEARLVPGLARSSHELSYEYRFVTPRTDISAAILWLHLDSTCTQIINRFISWW